MQQRSKRHWVAPSACVSSSCDRDSGLSHRDSGCIMGDNRRQAVLKCEKHTEQTYMSTSIYKFHSSLDNILDTNPGTPQPP